MKRLILIVLLVMSTKSFSLTPQQEDYVANFGMAYIAEDFMVQTLKLDPVLSAFLYMSARILKESTDSTKDQNDIIVSALGIGCKFSIGF